MKPVLALHDVVFPTIDELPADPVSAAAAPGAITLLHAPNSQHASALVRACLGMLPYSGRIELLGTDLDTLRSVGERRRFRQRIGSVLTPLGLLSNMTLRANVALPLSYSDTGPARERGAHVEALLRTCRLTHWADRRPGAVTPEVRARAAIARALACRPALLLLDRPMAMQSAVELAWLRSMCGIEIESIVIVADTLPVIAHDLQIIPLNRQVEALQ